MLSAHTVCLICLKTLCPILQVTVSEPQFPGDPASAANLTVLRSLGGEGVVYLIWLLEQEGRNDLQPHNGTLVFNGVCFGTPY